MTQQLEVKKVSTVSAMQGIVAKPEQKTEIKTSIKTVQGFRPVIYPTSGRDMFAYTIAILMVLGAFKRDGKGNAIAGSGEWFYVSAFKAFWDKPYKAWTYHLGKGNFEEQGALGRLTGAGFAHMYQGRVEGKNSAQNVDLAYVAIISRFIQTGKWEEFNNGTWKKINPEHLGFSKEMTAFNYAVK